MVHVPERALGLSSFDIAQLDESKIPQGVFLHNTVNPNGQILTKLKNEDLPILHKLMSETRLSDYAVPPTPSYGIKVGRSRGLFRHPSDTRLPIGKGLNISTFYLESHVTHWVDLSKVESRSIWKDKNMVEGEAYALSGITLAPQCTLIRPSTFALNDSARVFVQKPEYSTFPWDVLINSSIIRYAHLLTLRAGLVGVGTLVGEGRRAAWCVLYPRVIANFPVPARLVKDPGELLHIASELRRLAALIAERWQNINNAINRAGKKALALFGLSFDHWRGGIPKDAKIRLVHENGRFVLRPYADEQATLMYLEGPYELLNVVVYLIEVRGGAITTRELQELPVPEDFNSISVLVDNARNPDSPNIRRFKELHFRADEIIALAFGLTKAEFAYIQRRLSTQPLDVLKPRWPWKTAKRRRIKEYEADRFA